MEDNKIKIANNVAICPMPMVIVGTKVADKDNFMAVGWVSRVNFKPAKIAVSLGNSHYTNIGIHENKTFSVSYPSVDQLTKTDYIGIISGEKRDKSNLFDIFYGDLKTAPMIKECPVTMECKLEQAIDLGTNTLFIGEIIAVYSERKFLTEKNNPDIKKVNPFTLTMPDNNYYAVGDKVGNAWKDGLKLKNHQQKDE